VIAATNRDLKAEVDAGRFRQDLYYRVNVVRLVLPPLRERKEDIPLLAQHFVDRMNRLQGKDVTGLSREATASMMAYDWPGNIRELENAIEHAFVLCHGGLIELRHLPETLRVIETPPGPPFEGTTLEEIEKQVIHEALLRNDWKRLATAKELGINKTTLWRKMKRFGLHVPESKG
jgi:DNA-binding NtrC family response regulator